MKDSYIEVWDTPGLGVTLDEEATRPHLRDEDTDYYD